MDGDFVELSGGVTHYELKGAKGTKTIVLIHGNAVGKLREIMPTIEYHGFENAAHLAHYEFPERINPVFINFFKK